MSTHDVPKAVFIAIINKGDYYGAPFSERVLINKKIFVWQALAQGFFDGLTRYCSCSGAGNTQQGCSQHTSSDDRADNGDRPSGDGCAHRCTTSRTHCATNNCSHCLSYPRPFAISYVCSCFYLLFGQFGGQ